MEAIPTTPADSDTRTGTVCDFHYIVVEGGATVDLLGWFGCEVILTKSSLLLATN